MVLVVVVPAAAARQGAPGVCFAAVQALAVLPVFPARRLGLSLAELLLGPLCKLAVDEGAVPGEVGIGGDGNRGSAEKMP